MADGVDHDNENEDRSHKDVALLSSTGYGEGGCFLLDCSEYQDIEDNEKDEGNKAEKN